MKFLRFRLIGSVFPRHLTEETSGGELSAVPHYHNLPRPRDGPECIYGLDLTCLIDQQKIEVDLTGFKILCYGNRTHHKHRLDGLNGPSSLREKSPDRQVSPLLLHLATYKSNFAHIRSALGKSRKMGICDFAPRQTNSCFI